MKNRKQLRILVGDMPGLLREIIQHTVAAQSDMTLVGAATRRGLSRAIRRHQADLAIVADSTGHRLASHERLLLRHAGLKLLVVRRDGRQAELMEFRQVCFDDISPRGLIEAIRGAAGASTAGRRAGEELH